MSRSLKDSFSKVSNGFAEQRQRVRGKSSLRIVVGNPRPKADVQVGKVLGVDARDDDRPGGRPGGQA